MKSDRCGRSQRENQEFVREGEAAIGTWMATRQNIGHKSLGFTPDMSGLVRPGKVKSGRPMLVVKVATKRFAILPRSLRRKRISFVV
jgi:hypothetical protein